MEFVGPYPVLLRNPCRPLCPSQFLPPAKNRFKIPKFVGNPWLRESNELKFGWQSGIKLAGTATAGNDEMANGFKERWVALKVRKQDSGAAVCLCWHLARLRTQNVASLEAHCWKISENAVWAQFAASSTVGIRNCWKLYEKHPFFFSCNFVSDFFVACSPEGFDILCQKWVAEASRFDNQYVRCWCLNCWCKASS